MNVFAKWFVQAIYLGKLFAIPVSLGIAAAILRPHITSETLNRVASDFHSGLTR